MWWMLVFIGAVFVLILLVPLFPWRDEPMSKEAEAVDKTVNTVTLVAGVIRSFFDSSR